MENLKKLYDATKPHFSSDLSFEDFARGMADKDKRLKFYAAIKPLSDNFDANYLESKIAPDIVKMQLPEDGSFKMGDPWTFGMKKALNQAAGAAKALDLYLPPETVNPIMASFIQPTGKMPSLSESKKINEMRTTVKESKESTLRPLGEGMEKTAQGIKADAPQGLEDLPWYDWRKAYATIAQETLPMAAFMGAGAINPVLGTMYIGLVESGDALQSMRDYEEQTGVKIPMAKKKAIMMAVGVINAALERTGIETLLGRGLLSKAMKRRLVRFAVKVATEGITEGLQELSQIFGEKVYKPEVKDKLSRFVEAVYGGAVLAGGASGPVEAAGAATDAYLGYGNMFEKALGQANADIAKEMAMDNSARTTIEDVTGINVELPEDVPVETEPMNPDDCCNGGYAGGKLRFNSGNASL